MKRAISLLLIIVLAASLLTCCSEVSSAAYKNGSREEPIVKSALSPVGDEDSSDDVCEKKSIDEINDTVGCCVKSMDENYVCDNIGKERFCIIEDSVPIAQYSFTIEDIPVTVRAAVTKDDISGICMEDGTTPADNLDEEKFYDPIDVGCGIWTRWFVGGMQYSLLVGDGKDYSLKLTNAGFGNLLDLILDLRDYQAIVCPWYQEPYYVYEDWSGEVEENQWDEGYEGQFSFEGTFASRDKLAQLNKDFGKNFGTGTDIVFSQITDYEAEEHKYTETVSDIDEFLAAIAPDTEIILEPGEYVISDAKNYGKEDSEYYYWLETYDGYELVISADNLSITGPILKTEEGLVTLDSIICTGPRYSNVLHFSGCRNLELAGLTLGHTLELEGYCTGGVVCMTGCKDISLISCELYGCGTYGIDASDCTDANVKDCVIRSCTYGHTTMSGCKDVEFNKCSFLGCEGFTGNYMTGCKDICFKNCDFAYNDLAELFYSDTEEVELKNCFIVDNLLENGIFSTGGYGITVDGGACVELNTEEGTWTDIACG